MDMIDPDAEAEEIPVEDAQITYDLPPEEDGTDPDLEQIRDEDDWFPHASDGPGCRLADAGGAAEYEDDEDDQDREPDHDHVADYGIDQTATWQERVQ